MSKTAAIVIIGDEILSGQVEDCNSFYFSRELRDLGVRVKFMAVIPDDIDEIAETVRHVADKYEVVFTSGGIGPTHDDVTIAGIAKAFRVKVVRDPGLGALIRRNFSEESVGSALKMSQVPEGAKLINGRDLKFPLIEFRNIFVFPGIPEFLKLKFEAIKERFREDPFHVRTVHVNMQESEIAILLEDTLRQFGNVKIGSYPKIQPDGCKIKVTIESKVKEDVDNALDYLTHRIGSSAIIKIE